MTDLTSADSSRTDDRNHGCVCVCVCVGVMGSSKQTFIQVFSKDTEYFSQHREPSIVFLSMGRYAQITEVNIRT